MKLRTLEKDGNGGGTLTLRSLRCLFIVIIVVHSREINIVVGLWSVVGEGRNVASAPHPPAFGPDHTRKVDFPRHVIMTRHIIDAVDARGSIL